MHPDLDDTLPSAGRQARPAGPVAVLFPDTEDTVVRSRALVAVGGPSAASARGAASGAMAARRDTEPRYYRLLVAGSEIRLDSAVHVGRRPTGPRVFGGADPRLVRVQSPTALVSGNHLEVRQTGASVVLTDLGSTNGSLVFVPGIAPRRLSQGESLVVLPGTLVDIGDGNVLEILPLQRLAGLDPGRDLPEEGLS